MGYHGRLAASKIQCTFHKEDRMYELFGPVWKEQTDERHQLWCQCTSLLCDGSNGSITAPHLQSMSPFHSHYHSRRLLTPLLYSLRPP